MMRSSSLLRSLHQNRNVRLNAVRYVSMDVIEKAVGRRAATEFIQSMELNSKMIVSAHCAGREYSPTLP